jgi:hypothetical protein
MTLFKSLSAWAQHEATHHPHNWEREACPFCDDGAELSSAAAYVHHVAKHMREISLAALVAHCGVFDESDTSTDADVISDMDNKDSVSDKATVSKNEEVSPVNSDAILDSLARGGVATGNPTEAIDSNQCAAELLVATQDATRRPGTHDDLGSLHGLAREVTTTASQQKQTWIPREENLSCWRCRSMHQKVRMPSI